MAKTLSSVNYEDIFRVCTGVEYVDQGLADLEGGAARFA